MHSPKAGTVDSRHVVSGLPAHFADSTFHSSQRPQLGQDKHTAVAASYAFLCGAQRSSGAGAFSESTPEDMEGRAPVRVPVLCLQRIVR